MKIGQIRRIKIYEVILNSIKGLLQELHIYVYVTSSSPNRSLLNTFEVIKVDFKIFGFKEIYF